MPCILPVASFVQGGVEDLGLSKHTQQHVWSCFEVGGVDRPGVSGAGVQEDNWLFSSSCCDVAKSPSFE